jgi:20S proteasome alpha/beta subunit
MTVCVAAGCLDTEKNYKIVMCTDWRVSSPLGGAETKLKLRALPKGWYCLTAGTETEINRIVLKLRDELFATNETDDNSIDIASLVRNVLNKRKKEKIDEFIHGRYGISYDDFLSFGRDKFPADVHREAILTLSEIDIGCSLIVAGFAQQRFPRLVETTDRCGVLVREDFATVGEGAYLAQSVLLQRRHMDTRDLGQTIYVVYEAKRYAEEVASVGKQTTVAVISPDGSRLDIKGEGLESLADRFKAYGPQPIPPTIPEITKLLVKPF